MVRVTALGPDGSTLWEAPPVALSPDPNTTAQRSSWLPVLLLVLAGCVFLRWRGFA